MNRHLSFASSLHFLVPSFVTSFPLEKLKRFISIEMNVTEHNASYILHITNRLFVGMLTLKWNATANNQADDKGEEERFQEERRRERETESRNFIFFSHLYMSMLVRRSGNSLDTVKNSSLEP
ncbi:uncharacterized protein LOC143186921 [Calliopsis andreniformis]|uniref:uncharacterized protein LOC143186921 n=1 Tax=Calliopsis andreniformis TaxID=337506 RepID=UPI003FCC95F6